MPHRAFSHPLQRPTHPALIAKRPSTNPVRTARTHRPIPRRRLHGSASTTTPRGRLYGLAAGTDRQTERGRQAANLACGRRRGPSTAASQRVSPAPCNSNRPQPNQQNSAPRKILRTRAGIIEVIINRIDVP